MFKCANVLNLEPLTLMEIHDFVLSLSIIFKDFLENSSKFLFFSSTLLIQIKFPHFKEFKDAGHPPLI